MNKTKVENLSENKVKLIKLLVIPVIILSMIFILTKYVLDWHTSDIDHFYFEVIAVMFDVVIAFYCMNRGFVLKDRFFIFLGIGFAASAIIDALHAGVAINAINEETFLTYFIPQTWVAGRLVDSIMMIVAFSSYYYKNELNSKFESIKKEKSIAYSIALILAISIGAVIFSISIPLPNVVVDFPIHRPFDAIAAVTFLAAFAYYIKKQLYLHPDSFFVGLGIFLIINLFAEVIISISAENFDATFNVAHLLKNFSYFVVIIALSTSVIRQYKIKNNLSIKLEKSSKQKDEFLSMIAHELKNPLTSVQGYTDLLLSETSGKLNEDQKKKLTIIHNNTITLNRLISDFTDIQKLDLGVLKLNKKKIHLADAINESIINLRQEIEKYNIVLTTSLEERIICLCDKHRIVQVINNLLTNSIDFCPKTDGKINITLHSLEKNAEIIVEDNGIGMTEEQLGRVFTKFYQADSSLDREHGGTGLGLSICNGIIQGHGGTMKIESKIGRGTKVHIILPKNTSKDQNAQMIEDKIEQVE